MKYESMIKIIQDKARLQVEEEILRAVTQCEIKVDKEELINALKYDRHQYQVGYKDGIKEFAEHLKEHSCSYDLDNYHSFNGIDVEYLDGFVEEMQADVPDMNVGGVWIPCSERLPETNGDYLCTLYYAIPPYDLFHPENNKYIHDISVKKFNGESFGRSVIAWMPLPAPYKESED